MSELPSYLKNGEVSGQNSLVRKYNLKHLYHSGIQGFQSDICCRGVLSVDKNTL